VLTLDGRNPVYGYAPSVVKWPTPHSAQFIQPTEFLKTVYGGWWARKMVGPLPEEQKALLRLQFLGHTLFSGHKDGYALPQLFFLFWNRTFLLLPPPPTHTHTHARSRTTTASGTVTHTVPLAPSLYASPPTVAHILTIAPTYNSAVVLGTNNT
jgi:hypothetical protein